MLYGIDQSEIDDINIRHCNYKYFKDVRLEESIVASASFQLMLSKMHNIF